jgi:hypothetical protein
LEFDVFIIRIHTHSSHEEKVMSLTVTFVMGDRWRLLADLPK